MTCNHDPKLKCIQCHPELWHPSKEEIDALNKRLRREFMENLLNWKRAYYYPEDPEVIDSHIIPDSRYDSLEKSFKDHYPTHPFSTMVGYDASLREACLDWDEYGESTKKT